MSIASQAAEPPGGRVTLRGRLTAAFVAVVLGPVLVGAFFVSGTVATVNYDRAVDRLDLAATTVRTSVSALCQQLLAAADAVAVVADPAGRAATAHQVVARGLAGAVLVTDAAGVEAVHSPDPPPQPWADCAGSGPTVRSPRALVVRVETRDGSGAALGTVSAAQILDAAVVARLAAASGAAVTLLSEGPGPAGAVQSTESGSARDAVIGAAARLRGDAVAGIGGGRYARRAGPSPGQPLPLVLSVPRDQSPALYGLLVGAVLCAGLFAVLAAWRLARSTTRPLAELAHAADRVAGGDLAARVPVRTEDEVGRLASTFNRMTRETQAYVQALTASRDQLRGHLAILGHTLSSTHNLQRILQVILQSALTASGARAGAVLLLDQTTGTLVGQYTEGGDQRSLTAGSPTGGTHPDAGVAPLRVPLGSGLLGSIAATGEPRRGRIDRDGPTLSPFEPLCHTYLAVPFSASGHGLPGEMGDAPGAPASPPPALGVLALYDRLGSDEFDDSDLVTLRTFAGQAVVAVDNVMIHEETQRLSLTDPLTGLRNYRSLKESVRTEVERASRFGRMFTVLVLDLDRFKEVNDTYGHAAGDTVLVEFARRVRGALREVDLAFRQGGEEFVVLLPETDARGGTVVAERLGAAVRDAPIVVEPHVVPDAGPSPVSITVSIGIAVYPDHATTGQQVLDAADEALYAAKAAGRDTYRLAVLAHRPLGEEIAVPAVRPDDGLPWAGGPPGGGPGGASSWPQPPRQGRGR